MSEILNEGQFGPVYKVETPNFPLHPLCTAFPRASDQDKAEMAKQTREIGGIINAPAVVWLDPVLGEKAILDGGNRQDVARLCGVPLEVRDFTGDPSALGKAFTLLKPAAAGGSVIFDAMYKCEELLAAQGCNGRRVIVLVSESRDRGSRAPLDGVVATAQRDGIAIYHATYSAYATAFTAKPSDLPPPSGGSGLLGIITETARLVINTTIGIGGLFDPATQMGLQAGDEDFGQTLGRWGVPPGPYLVLPFFGPSTVRDTAGMVVDVQGDAVQAVDHVPTRNSLYTLRAIDTRANLLRAGTVLEGAALDKYSFTRDAYLQRRQSQVEAAQGETD